MDEMKADVRKQWLIYPEQNKPKITCVIQEGIKTLTMVKKNVRNKMEKETKLYLSGAKAKSEVLMGRINRIAEPILLPKKAETQRERKLWHNAQSLQQVTTDNYRKK